MRLGNTTRRWLGLYALSLACLALAEASGAAAVQARPSAAVPAPAGAQRGGRLTVALRAEPKTFNPLVASDGPSREIIWRTAGDLIHINRESQQTEPALARAWRVSADGRRFTLELRRGVRFSNGDAFDADDVVFSFRAYLDERVKAPQRDLLIVGGQPIVVEKADAYTVVVSMAQPYAAAERLFDGIAMLPRRLAPALAEGRLGSLWGVNSVPSEVVGLGPYRLKTVIPGERVVVERNPFYWKTDATGAALPYLDEIAWLVVPSDEAQMVRLQAGDIDVLNRVPPALVPALERAAPNARWAIRDLGASLEYNFLFFNQVPDKAKPIFQDVRFRRAISLVVDRQAVARLVYGGRATPLWGHVTPGNRLWLNASLPQPPRSVERARALLQELGCRWGADGGLLDPRGMPVTFTLLAAAGNSPMTETATLLQADLKAIGVRAQLVTLEFRAMLDRILQAHEYDAAVLRLGSGDVDPNGEMNVWRSNGSTHVWNPGRPAPTTPWEAELDRLMTEQLTTIDQVRRKAVYDRVQVIVAEQLPIIPLVSPNILVAAQRRLVNFRPAVLDHYTLWNADVLFWGAPSERAK